MFSFVVIGEHSVRVELDVKSFFCFNSKIFLIIETKTRKVIKFKIHLFEYHSLKMKNFD